MSITSNECVNNGDKSGTIIPKNNQQVSPLGDIPLLITDR